MTNYSKLFLVVLFSLAAVGLVVVLQKSALSLLLSIAFAVGLVYLLNRFMGSRRPNDKGYEKALRNQKMKDQKKKGKLSPSELNKLTRLKKPSRDIPFKVIEGNKKGKSSKDKDKEKQSHYH